MSETYVLFIFSCDMWKILFPNPLFHFYVSSKTSSRYLKLFVVHCSKRRSNAVKICQYQFFRFSIYRRMNLSLSLTLETFQKSSPIHDKEKAISKPGDRQKGKCHSRFYSSSIFVLPGAHTKMPTEENTSRSRMCSPGRRVPPRVSFLFGFKLNLIAKLSNAPPSTSHCRSWSYSYGMSFYVEAVAWSGEDASYHTEQNPRNLNTNCKL